MYAQKHNYIKPLKNSKDTVKALEFSAVLFVIGSFIIALPAWWSLYQNEHPASYFWDSILQVLLP